jgi:hypothetical protein
MHHPSLDWTCFFSVGMKLQPCADSDQVVTTRNAKSKAVTPLQLSISSKQIVALTPTKPPTKLRSMPNPPSATNPNQLNGECDIKNQVWLQQVPPNFNQTGIRIHPKIGIAPTIQFYFHWFVALRQ